MRDTANTPANIDADPGPSDPVGARSSGPGTLEVSEEAIARPGASGAAVVELPRKPGRPRGLPKPPTSGRRKGTRNRVTKEIAEIAQKHGKKIVEALVAEFNDTDDPDVKVKIATLVLSYGYGQPTRRSEVSGPGGAPIESKTTQIIEASERVVQALGKAATSDDPALALGDEGLRALQAANFILARRVAASREAGASERGVCPPPAPPAPVPHTGSERHEASANLAAEGAGGPDTPPRSHARCPSHADTKIENKSDPASLEVGEVAYCGGYVVECNAPSRDNLPPSYTIRDQDGHMITQAVAGWPGALAWIRLKVGPDVDTVPRIVKPSQPFEPSRPNQWSAAALHRPEVHRRRP